MTEYKLKYGCNPNQNPARIHMDGKELPFTVLNGAAGYINLLDAFNSWQLVRELKEATGLPSAASFKHVSPAGAAVAQPLDETDRKVCMVPDGLELSPIAQAYVRARSTDRQSSFGDFVALSDECDESVAQFLMKEVSDGIIAPSYSDKALELLKSKRRGNFLIIQMDPDYVPEEMETKQVFGIKFEQKRNNAKITMDLFDDMPTKVKEIPEIAKIDLLISMITLKYTQSNSVVFKERCGSFGEQVHLCQTVDEVMNCINGKPFLLQEYVECNNSDVRLEVVGDRVVAAMKRHNDNDFRSNITNGGIASEHIPTEYEKQTAVAVCKELGLTFGGVDILPNGAVCEVNSNAHIINIMNTTGVDVAPLIFDEISERIKQI